MLPIEFDCVPSIRTNPIAMTRIIFGIILFIAFVFGLTCLGACSSDEILAKQSGPPQEPIPDYKAIVSDALSARKPVDQISEKSKSMTPTPPPLPREWEIKNPELYAPFEISGAQQVNSFQGWAWLVCLKGVHAGRPIYFAVFIQHNRITNIRGNIGVDLCPDQLYEPLSISGRTNFLRREQAPFQAGFSETLGPKSDQVR